MISSIISRVVILVFGTLYPAYASYKAVRTASVKEYVKWMMYWIVFAFFTCIETFTDIFLAWFPFYYEIKVITVLWLLSPVTKGSSTLYRKFVHPMLTRREQEIDEYINQAKEKGYSAVLQLGSKGVNYATTVIMQTAIKTIQNVPINAPKTTELRAITQEGDTPDSVYMETNMLNEVNEYPTESTQQYPNYLNSSSEDEEEYHDEKDEDWNAGGAAGSRGVTTKRTQPARRTTRSSSANSNTTNVRARRRIRPDPELLIEVD